MLVAWDDLVDRGFFCPVPTWTADLWLEHLNLTMYLKTSHENLNKYGSSLQMLLNVYLYIESKHDT